VNSSPNPDQPPPEPPIPDQPGPAPASGNWLDCLNDPDDPGGIRSRWLCRLLETGPQPFAIVDLQQRIIQANKAFGELVGYSRDELLGMSIMDLTAPQSLAVTRRYHAEVLATGKNERIIKNYRRKDGSLVPVELMIDVFRDDSGQPRGLYAFITDISERVKAEQAVRNSEQRYRELYDEAPVGYHEIDLDTRIVSINRAACELLGYDNEELLGRSVLEIISPAQRVLAGQSLGEKLAGARPLVPYQQVLVTRDGRDLTVEIQEREHRGEDGQIAGLRSILQDVSKRNLTEAALVQSERRARALFDGIHDAVFVHDEEGRILDANPAACRQLGYSREELLEMTTSQIDVPEFAAGFQERLRRQLLEGTLSCEGLHRTKNGRIIPVEVTTSTIHFDNQVSVLAILRDITERKALERTRREFAAAQMRNAQEVELKNRALSESEARYRQLAEGSLDGIVVANGEGRITLFNPAAEKIFGYASRDVLDQPLEQLIAGVFPAQEQAGSGPGILPLAVGAASGGKTAAGASAPEYPQDPAAGSSRQTQPGDPTLRLSSIVGNTVELTGRRRDGTEFPLELSLSAVEMNGRPQYIGSIRDQTERQRMRTMLAHTDKLASIGLLSAGVAHEINNPLAYVLNNLVVLQREVKSLLELVELHESARGSLAPTDHRPFQKIDEFAAEIDWSYIRDNLDPMIEQTHAGVKRVASIVEKMRGLARTSPPQWESVSLADLVDNTLEMMRGRLKHQRVEVAVRIPELTRIDCVPDQIGQVLLNLLINALQAIEGSGRQEGGRIEVEGRLIGPWVAISVCDNGPGIEPEHRERLFDPFFTTKPVGEGTGLGLAISHGIITGHGGRIEVESREGEGSCFRILLPQHAQSSPPPRANSSIPPPRPA
jgi:two-component system NtrC family sensor kinase